MAFRALFTSFLLLLANSLSAQSVEWGNSQKIRQRNQYTQIVGESANGIFLLRCRNTDFAEDVIIEKYRTNLSLENSQPVPMTVNGNLERVLLVNGELYLFFSARNLGSGNIDLLAQKIDASLKPAGDPQVLCSYPAQQHLEKRKLQIKTSADRKHVLMMFLTRVQGSGETRLNLFSFGDGMKQVFGKQFTLNYAPDDVFITNFESDNNGNAFVLIDFPAADRKPKSDLRDFYLYAYYPAEDKMLAYALGNAQLFIEELAMCVNNFNQTISVMGLYSETGRNEVNGYFMERYSIAKRSTEEKYAARFEEGSFPQVPGLRNEKGNVDMRNYYIRKLIPRSDGGVLCVSEKYMRQEQRYSYYINNIPQEGVRVTYHYDDGLVFSLNPNGSMQFTSLLRKRQASAGDGGYYSGLAILPTQDQVCLFYNSEVDKDGNILMHTVSYQGKTDDRIAVKSGNYTVAIIPSETKVTGPSSMLACTIRDKQFTLIRITY